MPSVDHRGTPLLLGALHAQDCAASTDLVSSGSDLSVHESRILTQRRFDRAYTLSSVSRAGALVARRQKAMACEVFEDRAVIRALRARAVGEVYDRNSAARAHPRCPDLHHAGALLVEAERAASFVVGDAVEARRSSGSAAAIRCTGVVVESHRRWLGGTPRRTCSCRRVSPGAGSPQR